MSAPAETESPPGNEKAGLAAGSPQNNYSLESSHQPAGVKPRAHKDWKIRVERSVIDNPKLSCPARVLFTILRGYQGRNCRKPFPKIETLQSKLGGRDKIYKYLRELYSAGLIRCIKDRKDGKWLGNKYEFIETSPRPENRGVAPPTRKPPTASTYTANRDTKESHSFKECAKEAEAASNHAAHAPTCRSSSEEEEHGRKYPGAWQPEHGTKEEKLARIPTPAPGSYPTEREFNQFVRNNDIEEVLETYRPNLYRSLCENKWHTFREELKKWTPIREWQHYVFSTAESIQNAGR